MPAPMPVNRPDLMAEILRHLGLAPRMPMAPTAMPQLNPLLPANAPNQTIIPKTSPLGYQSQALQNAGRKPFRDPIPAQPDTPLLGAARMQPPLARAPLPLIPGVDDVAYDPGQFTPDNAGSGANLGDGVAPAPGVAATYEPGDNPGARAYTGDVSPQDGTQKADSLSALLQALGAVQPPAAPEPPRISSPPPPGKPQTEVGNMLKIMLASMTPPAVPNFSTMFGR